MTTIKNGSKTGITEKWPEEWSEKWPKNLIYSIALSLLLVLQSCNSGPKEPTAKERIKASKEIVDLNNQIKRDKATLEVKKEHYNKAYDELDRLINKINYLKRIGEDTQELETKARKLQASLKQQKDKIESLEGTLTLTEEKLKNLEEKYPIYLP